MKKLYFLTLFILFAYTQLLAQAPQKFNYQAIARDVTGNLFTNQNVSFRISILQGSAIGTNVYEETQQKTTNAYGQVTLAIGGGIVVTGNFGTINWGSSSYYIKTEMDATGGNNYVVMGTTQLLSVPYALFSGGSSNLPNGTSNGNTLHWNGTAWVADTSIFNNGTNVGIGTTTPNAKLQVNGTTKTTNLIIPTGASKNYVLTSDSIGNAIWAKSDLSTLTSSIIPDFSCMGTIGKIGTGTLPGSVAVSANYAYVVDLFSNDLRVYDISNPASPVWKNTGLTSTGTYPCSVAVSGNYAYVVDNGNGSNDLRVYDISNPVTPIWKNTAGTITGSAPQSVAVSGNYAYVVDYNSNDLRVYDISNPVTPVWKNTGGTSTGTNPFSVAVSGSYAYVTDYSSNDLRIYDISNPLSPVWKNTAGTSTGSNSNPTIVAVSGNYAYVVNWSSNDLRVYDISNPVSPVWKNTGGTSTGTNPYSVAVSGNYAYVSDNISNDLRVYDVSNPVTPVWKNTQGTSTGNSPTSIAVSGNYVYVVDQGSYDLRVINLVCGSSTLSINSTTGAITTVTSLWQESGNNISNSNNGGNVGISGKVGIGTTAPANTLDVSGATAIGTYAGSNTAPANGLIVSGNEGIGTATTVNKLDINGATAIGTYAGVNIAPANGIIVSGNEGIGTATTVNKLDIKGASAIGSYAGLNTAPTNGLIVSGNVGIGTASPAVSATLDITSTTQGFLPPRMTTLQRNNIATPATGLCVYTTDNNCLNFYNGTTWQLICNTDNSRTFNYTGSVQTFIVPAGVTSINIDIQGAQGGWGGYINQFINNGGFGGRVQGTITVSAGQAYYIFVGGAGIDGNVSYGGPGGFNGGGKGGTYTWDFGGGGGGASDIRFGGMALTNRIAVAGGGGGGSDEGSLSNLNYERGGPGGATTSALGAGYMNNVQGNLTYCGQGATTSAGGAGATGTGGAGALGIGENANAQISGGGGGAGYYGGGCGLDAGGGGGSNYTGGLTTAIDNEGGYRSGAGVIIISW